MDEGIPAKAIEVLATIEDPDFAERLRRVYEAAASTVAKLGLMDLVKYESDTIEDGPDLALWNEMAPVVGGTLMDVNALLNAIKEEFVKQPEETDGARGAADQAMRQTARFLGEEVAKLGQSIRSPSVMSDRWNLLGHLQGFRSRIRERIGEMVYDSISPFGDVQREEVVPGHAEDVQAAVTARATGADLARVVRQRIHKVKEAEREDIQWNAQQLAKEMELFCKTAAYKGMWSKDKQEIIAFRRTVGELVASATLTQQDLLRALEPFGEFVDGLQRINQRQILKQHDRETWAACGVKLETSEQIAEFDPDTAKKLLGEAIAAAMGLYGRDPKLDSFLRKTKKMPVTQLKPEEIRPSLELFRELLANIDIS